MPITDVLAAEARFSPTTRAPRARRVIVLGNTGQLGEALLARVLSSPRYAEVITATSQPIHSTHNKLRHCLASALRSNASSASSDGWPAVDEAIIVVGARPSFFKRDDVFLGVSEEEAIALARAAASAGATRLLVIAPMDAWLAATMSSIASFGPLEIAIRELNVASAWVIRPSSDDNEARDAHRGSLLQRIANSMLGALGYYLTPQSMQPLRAKVVAEAAMEWFSADSVGYHTRSARDLYAWLEARAPEAIRRVLR
jgi:hypothetical protein